jgi:hypothetical protein
MAQPPTGTNAQAREKRDVARRARRLAQTQSLDADRERLIKFAAELDREAEALEQATRSVSLPPVPATPQVQQQVQQQQSAATSTQALGTKKSD